MVANFKEWLAEPFKIEMDAFHWALFVGFMLICIVLWNRILSHMGEGF